MSSVITFTQQDFAPEGKRPAAMWRMADVVVPIFFMACLLGSVITVYEHNLPTTTSENSISAEISKVAVWP